jgi:nitrile hydratase accessory protein
MTTLPAPLPGLPVDADGPVFREPWQAHAFALAVTLHQRGLFTWPEWAQALAQQIAEAQARGDADLGDTYYQHWLAALEALVAAKGASSADELQRFQSAWDHAADRTPHGQPIELRDQDFAA